MEDLNSYDEAKILIEGLLPDSNLRLFCLNLFMDAIQEADVYGRDQWYIEPAFDGHVWLITGNLVTVSLVENQIWFSLDRHLMENQAGTPLICDGSSTEWKWEPVDLEDPTWVHISTVINGFYTPDINHFRIWPQLRRLVFETIYKSILNASEDDYQMEKVHSPGILNYICKETGRSIVTPKN